MQLINKNTAAQKSTQINANNQSDFQIILKNNLLKQ